MLKDYLENQEVLDFDVRLGKKEVRFNLADELKFDFETLNDELINHTRKSALIQGMYEERNNSLLKEQEALEVFKVQLWEKLKIESTDADGKKLSDARVTNYVEGNEEVITRTKKITDLKFEVSRLRMAVNAFKDKKDLMQTFSSNIRQTI